MMTENALQNRVLDILVVEDDDLLNQVMCTQLRVATGGSIRSARSGEEALKSIKAWVPSVLILDMGLPDMNGEELVARLQENSETRNLPLIVHTTLDLSKEQEQRLQLGPSKFVTKSTAFSDRLAELVVELVASATRKQSQLP
ncbi:MAG: response regulator [Candidatus Obscuribacterales bacterium]|nr:response regulator [Candidatus Obscuribacterales bacterium]